MLIEVAHLIGFDAGILGFIGGAVDAGEGDALGPLQHSFGRSLLEVGTAGEAEPIAGSARQGGSPGDRDHRMRAEVRGQVEDDHLGTDRFGDLHDAVGSGHPAGADLVQPGDHQRIPFDQFLGAAQQGGQGGRSGGQTVGRGEVAESGIIAEKIRRHPDRFVVEQAVHHAAVSTLIARPVRKVRTLLLFRRVQREVAMIKDAFVGADRGSVRDRDRLRGRRIAFQQFADGGVSGRPVVQGGTAGRNTVVGRTVGGRPLRDVGVGGRVRHPVDRDCCTAAPADRPLDQPVGVGDRVRSDDHVHGSATRPSLTRSAQT